MGAITTKGHVPYCVEKPKEIKMTGEREERNSEDGRLLWPLTERRVPIHFLVPVSKRTKEIPLLTLGPKRSMFLHGENPLY